MSHRKINKEATVRKIREAAEGHIKDQDEFDKLMENEQDILDACILWDVDAVYK